MRKTDPDKMIQNVWNNNYSKETQKKRDANQTCLNGKVNKNAQKITTT